MKPIFKLSANGNDITSLLNDYLVSLTLTDEAGSNSDKLNIVLDDRENTINLPKKGAVLTVAFGYAERGLIPKGSFNVDEIKLSWSPNKIDITARSANLRKELRVKRDKSFHKKKLSEIVQYIAKQHGLIPKIAGVLGSELIQHIDQTNESDISFLDRLADERDAVVKTHENMLIFACEATAKSISNKILPTVNINIKDTTSGSCTMNDRERYNTIKAYFYNKQTAEKDSVTVGSNAEPVFEIRSTYANKEEALKRASAKLTKLSRLTEKMTISMAGNPQISAESKLNITGLKAGLNGLWTVKKATHKLSNSGYNMTLELQPTLKE